MLEWQWGKILLRNFSNKPQKGYTEVQPDAGVPFRRLIFSDIQDLATCTFILNRTDYVRFMSWYKYDTRQGTIPFNIFDCRYKIDRTARIVSEVPQYAPNQQYYELSLILAFNSGVETFNWNLIINDSDYLIVNDNERLQVGVELRV